MLQKIEILARGLEQAAGAVNLEGSSIETAFDQEADPKDFKSAKSKKLQAQFLANECANLFFSLTGKEPKVSTNSYAKGNPACGEFFDFVFAVFDAVEIDASPETWARSAAKDFSPQNS